LKNGKIQEGEKQLPSYTGSVQESKSLPKIT